MTKLQKQKLVQKNKQVLTTAGMKQRVPDPKILEVNLLRQKLLFSLLCILLVLPVLSPHTVRAQPQQELVVNGDFNGLNGWATQPPERVETIRIPEANESYVKLDSAPNTVVSISQTIQIPQNTTSLKVSWIDHGYIEQSIFNEYRVILYDANMTKKIQTLFSATESIEPVNNSYRWNWGLHNVIANISNHSSQAITIVFEKRQGDGTSWVLIDQVSITPFYNDSSWSFIQWPLSIVAIINQTLLELGGFLLASAALFSLLAYIKCKGLRKKIDFIESYVDAISQTKRKED